VRRAEVKRETDETRITVTIDLDGAGEAEVQTGVPFFDHLLQAFGLHSGFGLEVQAEWDGIDDAHHLVEDVGVVLGRAVRKALGDGGIERFGWAYVAMDEALVRVVVDVSGRPYLWFGISFGRPVGSFHADVMREFFRGFCAAGFCVHIDGLRGDEPHHLAEATMKAFGRALGAATKPTSRPDSTKGGLWV